MWSDLLLELCHDAMTNITPDLASQWQIVDMIPQAGGIWSDHMDVHRIEWVDRTDSFAALPGPPNSRRAYAGRGAFACSPAARPRAKPK